MKVYVEIDLSNHSTADYVADRSAWHPTGDETLISIDKSYLIDDPTDDSFVLFKLCTPVGTTPKES